MVLLLSYRIDCGTILIPQIRCKALAYRDSGYLRRFVVPVHFYFLVRSAHDQPIHHGIHSSHHLSVSSSLARSESFWREVKDSDDVSVALHGRTRRATRLSNDRIDRQPSCDFVLAVVFLHPDVCNNYNLSSLNADLGPQSRLEDRGGGVAK